MVEGWDFSFCNVGCEDMWRRRIPKMFLAQKIGLRVPIVMKKKLCSVWMSQFDKRLILLWCGQQCCDPEKLRPQTSFQP